MKRILSITLCFLPLTGCLSKQLQTPVSRHATETAVIQMRCEFGGYYEHPCGPKLQRDLETTAKQADLINAIIETGGKSE